MHIIIIGLIAFGFYVAWRDHRDFKKRQKETDALRARRQQPEWTNVRLKRHKWEPRTEL